ncbi:MAG: glycosyltransferase [Candidatus Lokiarchaeota archaeon]|nr:glycosyltransferase [Candidatus Lokiarchaeota archaeon]
MKILMLCHTFPPYGQEGGSIRLVKFLKYLPKIDEDIHPIVVTRRSDLRYLYGEEKLCKGLLNEIPPNVRIERTGTFEPRWFRKKEEHLHLQKPRTEVLSSRQHGLLKNGYLTIKSILKRRLKAILNGLFMPDKARLWCPLMLKKAKKLLSTEGIAVIYATGPPFSVIYASRHLKKWFPNIPIILDIKDDIIDTVSYFARPSWVRYFIKRDEAKAISAASKVILVTDASRRDFQKRYPAHEGKFVLITNGVDLEEFRECSQAAYSSKDGRLSFFYSGGWGSRAPKTILGLCRAFDILVQEGFIRRKEIELRFAGKIPEREIKHLREHNLLSCIRLLGFCPKAEFIERLKSTAINLVLNYPIPTLIPGKIYEAWASKRPILLLDNDGIASRFVERHGIGWAAPILDVERIYQALRHIIGKWRTNTLNEISTKGIQRYSRKALTQKFADLLYTLAREQ